MLIAIDTMIWLRSLCRLKRWACICQSYRIVMNAADEAHSNDPFR